jgi:hypothetical protein
MSFRVKFYTVGKKKNSTYKPDESAQSRDFDCSIKENTSIIEPVLIIQYNDMTATPFGLNYCYIPSFKRYYWVKDWRNDNALWYAELKVDVLATYKEIIEKYNYYILRASTASDGDIIDSLYPMKPKIHRSVQTAGYLWQLEQSFDKVGTYVVGIVNKTGISNFYGFNPAQFKKFASAVFSDIKWMDFGSDITDGIAKMVMNPAQYITSVRWYPFGLSGTNMVGVTIGWWGVELPSGLVKLDSDYSKDFTLDVIPSSHPQISRGDYLNCYPYRTIRLYTPPFGFMEIDSSKVRAGDTIRNKVYVDYRTGVANWTASILKKDGAREDATYILGSVYGKIGFDVAVSDIKTDYASAIGTALGATSAGFSGNFIGASVGIGNAVAKTLSPEVSQKGLQGSTIGQYSPIRCFVESRLITNEDNADNGRPLCKNNTFVTLGNGYYVVENGSTPLKGAFDSEIDEVKNFLESGVYYA